MTAISEKMVGIHDGMPVPVFYLDADTNIVNCNQIVEEAFGLGKESICDKPFLELFQEDSRGQMHLLFLEAENYGKAGDTEVLLRIDGSKEIPCLLYLASEAEGTVTVNFKAVLIPITAQKKAEEELMMARVEAEIALQTKSKFLANLSHEIGLR